MTDRRSSLAWVKSPSALTRAFSSGTKMATKAKASVTTASAALTRGQGLGLPAAPFPAIRLISGGTIGSWSEISTISGTNPQIPASESAASTYFLGTTVNSTSI